jgi:hypothetical protein
MASSTAWKSLQAGGAPVVEENYANVAREILAMKIIELAKNGERGQRKPTDAALLQLANSG